MGADIEPDRQINVGWAAVPVLVLAATLVAFAPVLQSGFVNWDDPALFLLNDGYRGLAPANLRWMLTATPLGHWAPLTWLTHGIDYVLWGMSPRGHHLSSLLIHAATALAFYGVALQLLRLATPSRSESALRLAAGAAALFFAIHPMRVESVAWLTERRDVLSGLFFLLTIYAYLKAAVGERSRRKRWLTISVAFYALAVMSKTISMVLPAVLLVLDYYPLRRIGQRSWKELISEKLPFMVLALLAAATAAYGQRIVVVPLEVRPFLPRIATAFYGLSFYVWKTFVPYPISPLYEIHTGPATLSAEVVLRALAVVAISVTVIVLRRRWPALLAIWASYVIMLGPVIGITQAGPQLVASRYSYLSALGIALLVGAATAWLVDRNGTGTIRRKWMGAAYAFLLIVILSGLMMLTRAQSHVWRDSGTLWSYTLKLFPDSPIANHNFGAFLIEQGKPGEGERYLRKAWDILPGYSDAMHNLGRLAMRGHFDSKKEAYVAEQLARMGDFEAAADIFRSKIAANPRDAVARNNLGVLYYAKGDYPYAISQFEEALAISPAYNDARHNLQAAQMKR